MVIVGDDNPADRDLLGEALSELAVDADLVEYGDAPAVSPRTPSCPIW